MIRFLARLFAIVLSLSIFVVGAALLAQMRPVSSGGWVFMGVLGIGIIAGPVLVYRLVMGRIPASNLTNEGEGAGLVMGAGIDVARRRDGDVDADSFDFD